MKSDFTVDAGPAYGIVDNIRDLDEAISPLKGTPVADGDAPPPTPDIDDGELPDGGIFGMLQEVGFSGEDHLEIAHRSELELSEGTISLSFTADRSWGRQALFSKDFSGNREGGDLTAFVKDGRIEVRFQSAEESVWLKTASGAIEAGQEHHLAFTFGEQGAWLYVDGLMKDWEVGFTQGLEENTQNLAIGANTWARNEHRPDKTWDLFAGTIADFTIYNQQYDHQQVAELAGHPPDSPLTEPTVIDGVLYGTDQGETLEASDHGVAEVNGGYGDDLVLGSDRDDVLDGGHGEDRLEGGAGNDLLISRSDGREPQIAQDYDGADDRDGQINSLTRTYYDDQPILADDVLIGGAGADTFRFEVLINAKPEKILKHTMDNGMIHWHGVAGENNQVHDHWVDRLGNEVIWDFNRAEGDKIEVVGHTVDVYDLQHIDTDGDNVLDASVLYIQSNQGNAGAHNKDKLGTITVFGDLVMESDFTVDAGPAYGIVDNIRDLDEAISPLKGTPVADGDAPPPTPDIDDGELPDGGIFGMLQEVGFSGEDHVEVMHDASMQLAEGTIAMTLHVRSIVGVITRCSRKDFSGNRDGGDVTAFVVDGRDRSFASRVPRESVWLKTGSKAPFEARRRVSPYAFTFGEEGAWLYLNGLK